MKTAIRRLKTLPAWFYPLALLLIGIAGTALGAETGGPTYTPLVGIPGVTNSDARSLADYINALYILSISIGGLIGVVKISMAGVKYSMSDIVTSKEEAKEDIKGVLLGLGILLIPFIVLNTIYAGLTNLDVLKLKDADKIKLEPSKTNTGGGGGGPPILTQIQNCTSQTNSQWDYICKKCILKTETQGSSCGGSGGGPQVTNCTPIPNNPPQAQANCKVFCDGVKGTLSNGGMTCTWKNS